jgi:hypothetical protein
LLFILTYLKQNLTHVMHGQIFHMSRSNVSKWAHLLHGALNYALSRQHLLPARTADELTRRLREEPPPTAALTPPFIHDGVERPIHRPSDKVDRELYYSGKKKRHTLKNALIVDEFGAIHFLSDTYEGSMIHVSRVKRNTPFRTRVFSIKMPGSKDLTCMACW